MDRLSSLGISVVTRADDDYPEKYRERLIDTSPCDSILCRRERIVGAARYCCGWIRHLDEIGQACADFVGNACGISGLVLYSGGAKGVDSISMGAALSARGTAVGILADSLEKVVRLPDYRSSIKQGRFMPGNPLFSIGSLFCWVCNGSQ